MTEEKNGLECWLPEEASVNFFGLDRSIGSIRFEKKYEKQDLHGVKILWLNIKRCFKQRWKYYD